MCPDLQQRPGVAVYERGLYRSASPRGSSDQHERPGAGDGQHLHRAIMAKREVRGNLRARLRGRHSGAAGTGAILPLLQHRASTSRAGEPYTCRSIFPAQLSQEHGRLPFPPGEAKEKKTKTNSKTLAYFGVKTVQAMGGS